MCDVIRRAEATHRISLLPSLCKTHAKRLLASAHPYKPKEIDHEGPNNFTDEDKVLILIKTFDLKTKPTKNYLVFFHQKETYRVQA